tara:strand:+ start:9885 stop:11648 length:1764 start_codon:yes stop_codon:yes gene_type:complete
MNFSYKKHDNSLLFQTISKPEILNTTKLQNYIPIYNKFFKLNNRNYNNINLDNKYHLSNLSDKLSENIYIGNVSNNNSQLLKKHIFLKLSPMLDTLKYMTGKYDISNSDLFNLPSLDSKCNEKMLDYNNSAYTDGFFYYLISKLLHEFNFIHGIDYYGSFIGIKENYIIDIADDIDVLYDSAFFQNNNNILFTILDDNVNDNIFCDKSRSNKLKLNINNKTVNDTSLLDIIENLEINNTSPNTSNKTNITDTQLIYNTTISNHNNSLVSNACSSRSSNTYNEEDDFLINTDISSCISTSDIEDNEIQGTNSVNSNEDNPIQSTNSVSSNEESSYEESSYSSIDVSIKQFPILIIGIEMCKCTMDEFILNNELSENELSSFIIQILIILITYQKMFDFTHNDLHTNNIMYIETDKQYLYYKYNNNTYKVPTFGKIVKIIDFGRAIYKFRNKQMFSDSYHKDGDAATQYNCEPYYDERKKYVPPNYSFDLCRLGCALYDVITENYNHYKISSIITEWCIDDSGRNVLYKNNGEERYPDFKLYKMIARSVTKHTPQNVLNNEYFSKYILSSKKTKKQQIINIDMLPRCYE